MLSMSVFQQGINDIQATYVSKRFNPDDRQLTQWYKLLKGLTDDAYLSAIDEWCATKSALPSPSELIESANRLRNIDNTPQIPKNAERCSICHDEGVISHKHYDKEMKSTYEYVVCCVCEAGQYCHSIYDLPQLNPSKVGNLKTAPKSGKFNIEQKTKTLGVQMKM